MEINEKKLYQLVVNVDREGAAYYNFFYVPYSLNSLKSYIDKGLYVKFIKDYPEMEKAVVVFEGRKHLLEEVKRNGEWNE